MFNSEKIIYFFVYFLEVHSYFLEVHSVRARVAGSGGLGVQAVLDGNGWMVTGGERLGLADNLFRCLL